MDILTLELFDVTVSQALLELSRALEQHPGMPVRVLLEGEQMILHNVQRFLERQERKVTSTPMGSHWQLDIEAIAAPKVAPVLHPIPAPVMSALPPRPLLVLRSAFVPGDRALGRRLMLGILRNVSSPVPWVGLAHEALELLEDPQALEVLAELRSKGISIRVSQESLAYFGKNRGPFESMEDRDWQTLAAKGELTLL